MKLDIKRIRKRGRLTHAEHRELIRLSNETGLCMFCGGNGHRAPNCLGAVICGTCYGWTYSYNKGKPLDVLQPWWEETQTGKAEHEDGN